MPIIMLAPRPGLPHNLRRRHRPLGVEQMTTCDEIETSDRPSVLSKIATVLLFVAVQGIAIAIVGFAALFLSFEPVWSAQGLPAGLVKPADARSGSLLLKTDDGYADATRLGIDVELTVSGPTIRARVT